MSTLDDAMKVLLPLVAGGVSAYSRPAARAIEGATGAYMAMDESKRREAAQAQELALRQQEADLRGQEIAASTERNKHDMTLADQAAARQQNAAQALGATFGNIIKNLGGPGPMAPGTVTPEGAAAGVAVEGSPGISEGQAQNNNQLADAARIAQGALGDDRLAGPAINNFLAMPEGQARLAQAFQQYKDTLAQRQAELANTQAYRNQELDIRNREAAAREKDANTRAAAATGKVDAAAGKGDAKTLSELDKEITKRDKYKAKIDGGTATPEDMTAYQEHLANATALAAARAKRDTGASYLDKLGIGANR